MGRVRGTIVRGFITRNCPDDSWEADLEEYAGEPCDSDAIPYYMRGEDGRYYEWYGRHAPPKGSSLYLQVYEADPESSVGEGGRSETVWESWQRVSDTVAAWAATLPDGPRSELAIICRNSPGPCFCGCHRSTACDQENVEEKQR